MRLRYLLDTNICIYISKHRPPEVLARFKKLRLGEVAMSVITHGELWYGVSKSSRQAEAQEVLQELAAMIPVLSIGSDVGERYGEVRSDLEKSGRLIGNNDLWIAAHALALEVVLVTNDESEFVRVKGLAVENWVEKPSRPEVRERKGNYDVRARLPKRKPAGQHR
jgi:tRNA(fMet)-specific endonuclease VapC